MILHDSDYSFASSWKSNLMLIPVNSRFYIDAWEYTSIMEQWPCG